MNPYIGDRQLEPEEEPERPARNCRICEGDGFMTVDGYPLNCTYCNGTGQVEMTDEELAQKQFDDFEPNNYPENEE